MAFSESDWTSTTQSQLTFAPQLQDAQRTKIVEESETYEIVKEGINTTATHFGYWSGTEWVHYIRSDGDAQLRWKYAQQQIAKDTKYAIDLNRQNTTVELDYFLELSSADNPTFKIYDISNNLLATFLLINAGSTNKVMGTMRFAKVGSLWVATAIYSYIKNTSWYHENQTGYLTTQPAQIAFGADNGYTYNASSYVKITNK